jgi:hypothetical protein
MCLRHSGQRSIAQTNQIGLDKLKQTNNNIFHSQWSIAQTIKFLSGDTSSCFHFIFSCLQMTTRMIPILPSIHSQILPVTSRYATCPTLSNNSLNSHIRSVSNSKKKVTCLANHILKDNYASMLGIHYDLRAPDFSYLMIDELRDFYYTLDSVLFALAKKLQSKWICCYKNSPRFWHTYSDHL